MYTRTHFLSNTGDGTPAFKWGSTNRYTWTRMVRLCDIDEIMDLTVAAGVFALVEKKRV